ncbi:outer membrane protein assembly factor BamB family protein [Bythopirellula polymerisocia]|uniref:Outer membrane biogenesis protein BamB n=1 Tax=Bythopirellula polymerisocia TaxID=2528003 RepID=A0A5C6CFI9_9BACT|nr:PQQ-binding-like beta-propeller repeat protein [Bythopirellula polymerisocia]TWU23673.1 outer membrane biogenesis protein BamB [Bythopirellula polymerisocia]
MKKFRKATCFVVAAVLGWWASASLDYLATHAAQERASNQHTKDWPQWGGSAERNNTPIGHNIPTEWKVGKFNYTTGEWDPTTAKNIKWVSRLGSQTYGNAVVADGQIYVGTNNSGGWIERYPSEVDLGCLIAFDIKDGKFLWQHSSEKLPTGRVHDWPLQGICCAPLVEGDRLWFVTSRGEVRCLDTKGFRDGENDGPYTEEEDLIKESKQPYDMQQEADVVWVFDMMKELGISQHNMCSCSVTAAGDLLFVNTSNGVDVEHNYIPAPDAPSFFVMDKNSGKVLWTDNSPGLNILHGQWSSPTYFEQEGQAQVIFAGGDGWVYSFDPAGDGKGNAKLLWKFDANPKTSKWELGGRGTRNNIIATPVFHKGKLYVAVGQDPEHGEGIGHLWCIDPTKRGNVSPELAFNSEDPKKEIPHKRVQAVIPEEGDLTRPNPNSAAIWHYNEFDQNGNGKIDFEETMHRSCGTVAIRDGILYISDFSGLFHCLDAETGKVNWTYDLLSAAWGSPLIVEDKVYIGDEDGEVAIFRHSADPEVAMEDGEPAFGTQDMGNSVYSTPIVADNVLYISNRTHLFAITPEGK